MGLGLVVQVGALGGVTVPFWKSLHLGILMGDATVSAQREQICGGSLQWTSTPSRRINSNSRSEAGIAFMIYA